MAEGRWLCCVIDTGSALIYRNRNVIDKNECDTTEGYWYCLNDHRSYRLLPVSANDRPAHDRAAGLSDFCVHDCRGMQIYKKQSAIFLHNVCYRLHLFGCYLFCGKKPVCRIAKDKKCRSKSNWNGIFLNLLAHGFRPHSSSIPLDSRSESNPHSPAGHYR